MPRLLDPAHDYHQCLELIMTMKLDLNLYSLKWQFSSMLPKYILNDFTSDYKSRLIALKLLPLMYWLELQDIMFLSSCLQNQSDHVTEHFNITNFIQPCTSSTRSSAHSKLKYVLLLFLLTIILASSTLLM